MTEQKAMKTAVSMIQRGIEGAMPDLKKAAEEMANFDRAFKKEQKRIREKIYGGIRRSQADPV